MSNGRFQPKQPAGHQPTEQRALGATRRVMCVYIYEDTQPGKVRTFTVGRGMVALDAVDVVAEHAQENASHARAKGAAWLEDAPLLETERPR